jgi:cytidylate kinase
MGNDKGIVMDGRDIGTVVFQMLNLKYLQAQLSEQALR